MRLKMSLCGAALLFGMCVNVMASSMTAISFGAGAVHHRGDAVRPDWQIRLRSGDLLGFLTPWLGAEVTNRQHGYAWGGALLDVPLSQQWTMRPGLGMGYVMDSAAGSFSDRLRSRIELSLDYQLNRSSYFGLGVFSANDAFTLQGSDSMAVNCHYMVAL
jgi:hypothetical protein